VHHLSFREIPFEVLSPLGKEIFFTMIILPLRDSLNSIFIKNPISMDNRSKTMEGCMTLIKTPTGECILAILLKSETL
jgi:hypothetical protein